MFLKSYFNVEFTNRQNEMFFLFMKIKRNDTGGIVYVYKHLFSNRLSTCNFLNSISPMKQYFMHGVCMSRDEVKFGRSTGKVEVGQMHRKSENITFFTYFISARVLFMVQFRRNLLMKNL